MFIYDISSFWILLIEKIIYIHTILNYEKSISWGICDNLHHFEIKTSLKTFGRLYEFWNKEVYEIAALAWAAKELRDWLLELW